jgi:hypothetical protein
MPIPISSRLLLYAYVASGAIFRLPEVAGHMLIPVSSRLLLYACVASGAIFRLPEVAGQGARPGGDLTAK